MATVMNIDKVVSVRIGEETLRFHCAGKQKKLPCGRWVALNPVSRQAGIGQGLSDALRCLREKTPGSFGSLEIEE
jgi:hypothetical protein